MLTTRGFTLEPWQQDAVEAWARGDDRGPFRGTLEIVTGGGKSLIALAAAERAAESEPGLRLAVVVPTEALARQWTATIAERTNLTPADIGLLGAGGRDRLTDKRALVAVLNTAAEQLPAIARPTQPLMLVVDECHRAGAPSFARVLDTPARFRLGLSATPDREELDDDGQPITYDDQRVGRSLGGIVYRFSLRDAREYGWLPDYVISHHGVALSAGETARYEAVSRRVDDLSDQLRQAGADVGRAQQLQVRGDELGVLARSYIAATAGRKDLLYRASERNRVTERIVREALERGRSRVLLFHERVDEAVSLADQLRAAGTPRVGLEHSRLGATERIAVMDAFRSGELSVLVSVKSLVEGIDVPEADVGVSVASSSSVRQRVQSLGRVLRRQFDTDGPRKLAEMHVLYVADTVDEFIYAKEDWADLTGEDANRYWRWQFDGDPEPLDGPPASPRPTEEQEWERLGGVAPTTPEPWLGLLVGQEYSVDTMGTVTNQAGATISNPQGVADVVSAVRGRPGGRFRVTPTHRLLLVRGDLDDNITYVAGQLGEPFVVASPDVADDEAGTDVSALVPGDRYTGPADRVGGTYKLSQKRGGVIERRAHNGTEFAIVEASGAPELEANGRRVLDAWRQVLDRGITFHVNGVGHAWYAAGGQPHFLAEADGGFAWPTYKRDEV